MATDLPLGTRIRRARERKRWTQQQLADALNVDRKTVDNWENGRTRPRSSIGAIETALDVNLSGEPDAGTSMDPEEQRLWDLLQDDPNLDDAGRRRLMENYRQNRAKGAAARRAAG